MTCDATLGGIHVLYVPYAGAALTWHETSGTTGGIQRGAHVACHVSACRLCKACGLHAAPNGAVL
jgi:hypothetical protein